MKRSLSSFRFRTQNGCVLKYLRRDVTHHQRKNQLVVYYVKLRKDHSILGLAITVTAEAHPEIQHGSSTVSRLQYGGKL